MCFKVVQKVLGGVAKVVKEVATPLGLGGAVKAVAKINKEIATPLGLGGVFKGQYDALNKPKATTSPPALPPALDATAVASNAEEITSAQESIVDKIKKREKRRQSVQTVFAGQGNEPNLGVFNAKN